MAHPAGPRLAPLGYATPLLSTLILLATGQRLSTIALVGCALIVLCAIGVTMKRYDRRDKPHIPHRPLTRARLNPGCSPGDQSIRFGCRGCRTCRTVRASRDAEAAGRGKSKAIGRAGCSVMPRRSVGSPPLAVGTV